jgi:hypothetical protein
MPPSARTTRWHGTMTGSGLAAQALPTARKAFLRGGRRVGKVTGRDRPAAPGAGHINGLAMGLFDTHVP